MGTSYLDRVVDLLVDMASTQLGKDEKMARALARLQKEVEENRDAIEAAMRLIEGISKQIRDKAGDEAAMNKLADDLDAQSSELAESVTANTPFDPSGQ